MDLNRINLSMFDGEGGGEAAAGTQAANGGEISAAEVLGQNSAGKDSPKKAAQTAQPEPVQETFADLVGRNGKYRSDFQQTVDRIVKDRLAKATKAAEAAQPVIDLLTQKYGTDDLARIADEMGKDESFWQEAADEAGMTVQQYRDLQMLKAREQRLNAQVQSMNEQRYREARYAQWRDEAEALKGKYPGLDLMAEVQNPTFMRLLDAGAGVENAYKTIHHDELVKTALDYAMGQAQKSVADTVRANGMRPAENGAGSSSAPVTIDITNMTREQRNSLFSKAKKSGAAVKLF